MADLTRVIELVEKEATASGFDLVRVKLFGQDDERTLQIMAEDPATGQLVIEQCMALSRRISNEMDAREEAGDDLIYGPYRLEVSSPGIDRPLTRAKDYANWVGHEARINISKDAEAPVGNRRTFHGDLIGIDGELVAIEDRKNGRVDIPLDTIHSAKLVLTDKLIKATVPLDTTGADEIIETEDDLQEQED
ncbi:ribosome maturation protein RimP [Croceicoccus naphthovorans]|uniref:Ribosome maturation factor RimP n=1 Tax=Croceicoccus naphthovorans TaxID=1348774 RepID=A0A0G3XCE3_9SPHN|nr:ribosome maturation protein RimP [Croceicoccus naphthovorans]AKM08867.1 ribosome maturation protein RimP [Croceicoccus naphthovorans]MBB3989376.1 ribosome maturation factor RimP [Croceicoccus naphthovorans]